MTVEAGSPHQPFTPHEAARLYATHGYRVVPIAPKGKHPHLDAWQTAATSDLALIDAWWTGIYRGHGVGLLMGHNQIFALDVDVSDGKAGDETLRDLEDTYHELPETVEQITGSGGRHLIYRAPAGIEVRNDAGRRLGPGLDIRGIGGQIVAAPTIHPNGAPYVWVWDSAPWEREVADAPDWLIGLLTRDDPSTEGSSPPVRPPVDRPPDTHDRPGDRFNATTTWPGLLENDGWTRARDGHAHEQRWTRPGKTTKDGISATVGYKGSDVLKVFTSSIPALEQDRTYTRFGYWAATRFGGSMSDAARALGAAQRDEDIRAIVGTWGRDDPPTGGGPSGPASEPTSSTTTGEDQQASPLSALDRLRASLLTMAQLRALPPPRWRIDGIFYDGSVVLLWSPPGGFKSFVAADMALSIAYGVRWHDRKVWHGPVIYYAGEGKAMFQQRIDAWLTTHNRQDTDTFVLGPLIPNLMDATWRAAAHDLAIERMPALVVFDTVARAMVGGEENSAKDMGILVDLAGRIAQTTGAIVLLVHHSTKTGEHYRGSSALQGAVDTEIEVQRDGMNVTLHCRKQKDAYEFDPIRLHLEACVESLVVQPNHLQTGVEVDPGHQAILDVLTSTGASTYGQIEKRSGLPPSTFLRKLNDLVSRDVVTKNDDGKYDLAD